MNLSLNPDRNVVQDLWRNLNSTESPGLNGMSSQFPSVYVGADTPTTADALGDGSTQSSGFYGYGNDAPFWDGLKNLPNLHAVVSGHDHGNEWCKRSPADIVFCFAKHSGFAFIFRLCALRL